MEIEGAAIIKDRSEVFTQLDKGHCTKGTLLRLDLKSLHSCIKVHYTKGVLLRLDLKSCATGVRCISRKEHYQGLIRKFCIAGYEVFRETISLLHGENMSYFI